MRFTLEIEIGNDGLRTYREVRQAVADSLRLYQSAVAQGVGPMMAEDTGFVFDGDGANVGGWQVTEGPIAAPALYDFLQCVASGNSEYDDISNEASELLQRFVRGG